MATYKFDKIEYNGNTYVVSDSGALPLTGGQVTGPVTFGDTVSIDEATVGDLVVNGSASFTNNIQANTISGDLTGDVTGNVVGNVSGNATTATKATQDGSGNTITSTYMKLSGTNTNSATNTFSGSNTFSNKAFYYTGIENGTTNADRVVWFADASYKGKPVYNESFKYNPSTNVLTVGSITGSAATATKATKDGSGNTITSYYCTLSTAQTVSGVKTFSAMPIANGISVVSTSPGTSGGLSLYTDKTPTNYGIAMRNTSSTTKHGYVQGDWATYLYMAGAENRGWIFYGNGGLRASISNAGNAVFNGSVTVGGNSGNTAGCEMVYDSTNECMNLTFK